MKWRDVTQKDTWTGRNADVCQSRRTKKCCCYERNRGREREREREIVREQVVEALFLSSLASSSETATSSFSSREGLEPFSGYFH